VRLAAREIHAQIGPAWPSVLAQLGIDESFLRPKKAGPCPACGGRDRYTFDNRNGHGDFFCRGCGPGDGFDLLTRVHGWKFGEAIRRVAEAAGLADRESQDVVRFFTRGPLRPEAPSSPTRRVREILRGTCEPADAEDAIAYLESRKLWPLPQGLRLRAHASVEYWHDGKRLGRFAALVADLRDVAGELVTLHLTYLAGGRKLPDHEPRKLLSPLTGRQGCAARLTPLAGDTLGVAEGLETAIAAHRLQELPTWAALNAGLLAKFEPPPTVRRLVVFADRDAPGLEAAARLMERLQGRVRLELRVPPAPAKDWADVLAEHAP
jgi:putative DNA primase/helicase